MDDQVCPRCKTTKYRNPSLKLMVNVCGHTLCESCVDLLFLKGSGACPECNVPLRRSNFRIQLFEDPMVEKEVNIRKRILRDYNKKEDDFDSLEEFNNYLEEIELIVFNLANDIDIVNTNKRIEQYKKDNREVITKNKGRIGREEYELDEMIEEEKQIQEERQKQLQQLEQENKKKKLREKEALIDELMSSHQNAADIVSVYAKKAEQTQEEAKVIPVAKATQFSTGIKFSRSGQQGFLPVPKLEEGPLYSYKPLIKTFDGPEPPQEEEILSSGYIKHIRAETSQEKAGGYTAIYACQRALQEALQGLYD
ncbi:CDK-activating kinase assembly factor MAT1 [Phlebotomus argentipes]|uniref:CDK-activating kinase assembly factor MAT1 n=1 Tax=Phlebotomus argentipes TaxID=94469 RepID=UPI0028934A8D|nr:CDK-activating kinase assembly factor MAT1 [Phlebotomus argentipes]